MWCEDFNNFFKIPNFFFKSVGFIINEDEVISKLERFLIELIFYLSLLNINACLLGECFYVKLSLNGNNFVDAVMTLSYIGFVFTGDFKILYIRWKQQELKSFLNGLYVIFPKDDIKIQKYDVKGYLRKCTRITMAFSVLYMLLIWTYNLYALMEYWLCNHFVHGCSREQKLPYTVYIPWNWHGHWTFYLLYALQSYAGYACAAGQIANDIILYATATQVIMHYDYLRKSIESFNATNDSERSLESTSITERNLSFLKDFANYHGSVLRLSDQMNSLFGISLLLNFMTSSFVICFVGFQMTIGVPMDILIKLFIFLISSMAQVFLISYYGEELKNASENIALAVFQHNWHNADLRYKKMLVLIAERAQKPAMLQATSFLPVSQSTMTDILQMSYKFFALLRTLYDN